MTEYEPVIGLEVHAQLSTESKLFSWSANTFGASPNSHVDVVCLGMPGVLPVLNERAVELAVRAAIGLECTIHSTSQWSRKNYFYPDLPKGYQISQFDRPYATQGSLAFEYDDGEKTVGITRIHMEEDAGKNVHDDLVAGRRSYVDFNRAGVPLIEIVSEPEIRSAAEAAAYMRTIRQVLRYLEVCDGNMEEGSLRCDANVSLRPRGQEEFGTRAEIKNINSFRFVEQAIDYEILRQEELLRGGGTVVQETRLWDSQAKKTRSMRSKEDAHDYRYFPDPDLPELVLEDDFVAGLREALPELPKAKIERYRAELELSDYDAKILTDDAEIARFFESALDAHNNPKGVANWVINEVLREVKDQPLSSLKFDAAALGRLVGLIDAKTISGTIAKEVFAEMLASGTDPAAIVEAKGLKQLDDTDAIAALVATVLADNAESVAKYKAGKTNVKGFLVGQVMKASRGKANPQLVNRLLDEMLADG
ncbi:MAG: Asp-tRNA(Asn)/Glu-tRNA(Gln) amidotransferase subunit GatB [Myxococcota bacterium]